MLLGCDFSSAPTRRKPIVLAVGEPAGPGMVRLDRFVQFADLASWGEWLARETDWVGAFDFPFGLPRELVCALGWPTEWEPLMRHYASLSRAEIRDTFAAFCNARPVGGKFAHRRTDAPAGSSPSMKWVNPPVAFMLQAGVPPLIDARAALPPVHGDARRASRVALEGYPGLLARELVGRQSYKSDSLPPSSPAQGPRAQARAAMIERLGAGRHSLGITMLCDADDRTRMLHDAKGDTIDAVLCLIEAAWAWKRRDSPGPGFGLPADADPLEGWIVAS